MSAITAAFQQEKYHPAAGTSVPDLAPRNVNTLYGTVRRQTLPHDIERLFEVAVLIAHRSIRKIATFRFFIHIDLVFGQVVLQRELIFPRSQEVRMLFPRQVLNQQKDRANNHQPTNANPQQSA